MLKITKETKIYSEKKMKLRLKYKINYFVTRNFKLLLDSIDVFEKTHDILINLKNKSSIWVISNFDNEIYQKELFKGFLEFIKTQDIKINYKEK
jgi:hypothetical protein